MVYVTCSSCQHMFLLVSVACIKVVCLVSCMHVLTPSVSFADSSRADWMLADRHVRYGPDQSCCRPFCKLKRKEHYHCNACNQAFSDVERLRPHIAKHSSGALSPQPAMFKREPEDNNNDETNDSGKLSKFWRMETQCRATISSRSVRLLFRKTFR